MKKISFVVLICILCSWFMVGCDKSYTYEEAYNLVINDIEENGEDLGEGYKLITKETSVSDEKLIIAVKNGVLMLGLFHNYGDVNVLYFSTYITFHAEESDDHYFETMLTVRGTYEGRESIKGEITASTYTSDTDIEFDEFEDPDNLADNGALSAYELADRCNGYVNRLLNEFEKYLNGIEKENLTIQDFGFESY